MAIIKFKSVGKTARTASFDVDGKTVVRKIPDQFTGTIEDYLSALAKGLATEAAKDGKVAKKIEAPKYKASEVMIDTTTVTK